MSIKAIGVPYWFISEFASHITRPGGSSSILSINPSYSAYTALPSYPS